MTMRTQQTDRLTDRQTDPENIGKNSQHLVHSMQAKRQKKIGQYVTAATSKISHHIEEADAGLDRPLYLRNKCSDKTLKLQNLLI